MSYNIKASGKDLFGNMVKSPEKIMARFENEKPAVVRVREVAQSQANVGTLETIAIMKPDSIVQVNVYRSESKRPINDKRNDNLNNLNGNGSAYNGYLSPNAMREIKKRLGVWLTSVDISMNLSKLGKGVDRNKIMPTFVTVTLPSNQVHSDLQIKKYILDPFLSWLKVTNQDVFKTGVNKGKLKGFGVETYFWRAETQKNGNVHFHIICDRYIPWERIRQKWNALCESFGAYVSSYHYAQKYKHRNGMSVDIPKMKSDAANMKTVVQKALKSGKMPKKCPDDLKEWLCVAMESGQMIQDSVLQKIAIERQKVVYLAGEACNWSNPNSIDIHGVQGLQSIAAYVIKYVTKEATEVKLKPNQEIIRSEIDGKEYVHTFKQVLNKETGELEFAYEQNEKTWKTERVEVEEMKLYKPVFEERMIMGKIWGTSDSLTPKKSATLHTDENGTVYYEDKRNMVAEEMANEFQQSLVKEDGSMFYKAENGQKYHINWDSEGDIGSCFRVKRHYELKYFTKVLSERAVYRTEWTPTQDSEVYYSDSVVVDQDAIDYVDGLVAEIGPEIIDRISDKVGDSFKQMEGRIIPLMSDKLGYRLGDKGKPKIIPQGKIMANRSPKLKREYDAYYTNIFHCMYNPNS